MPAHFENDRKFDGNKLRAISHFDANKYAYTLSNGQHHFEGFENVMSYHFRAFKQCRFKNIPVTVSFQNRVLLKSAAKNVPFPCESGVICQSFHRFQSATDAPPVHTKTAHFWRHI